MRKCLCHKDLRGFVYVFLPPYLMEWAQKTAVFMQMIRIMILKMILFLVLSLIQNCIITGLFKNHEVSEGGFYASVLSV